MKKFDKVKKYYDNGYWDKFRVADAVVKKWITAEEYEEITGEPYEEYRYYREYLPSLQSGKRKTAVQHALRRVEQITR